MARPALDDPEWRPRVFLAAPFTQLIDSGTGLVDPDWRGQLRSLRDALRRRGHSVFLAHDREAWGAELMGADECTPLDFKEMVAADVVCAYVGSPPSHGVHIELGWASALGKRVLVLVEDGVRYTPLLWGIPNVTAAEFFHLAGRSVAEVASDVAARVDELLTGPRTAALSPTATGANGYDAG